MNKQWDKFGDDVLSSFADIADCEPKFFKKNFIELTTLMSQVIFSKEIDDTNLKETATETLILILERLPSIGKQDQ